MHRSWTSGVAAWGLLAVCVALQLAVGRDHRWPLTVWNMYLGGSPPPGTVSRHELRVFAVDGELVAVVTPEDVFGQGESELGDRILVRTFEGGRDAEPYRRFWRHWVRHLDDPRRIGRLEGWRTTWEVSPRARRPLSQPARSRQLLGAMRLDAGPGGPP